MLELRESNKDEVHITQAPTIVFLFSVSGLKFRLYKMQFFKIKSTSVFHYQRTFNKLLAYIVAQNHDVACYSS